MRIVIVGAGLTGLSAAWHLARRGVTALVVERESEPGGACRTTTRNGFTFDLTGHLLHLARPGSEALVEALGVRRALRRHRRRAGVALAGTVTPYPIQIHTARLPREIRRDCLLGFVEARVREAGAGGGEGRAAASAEASFAEWAVARFGTGLAHHFFLPYNRKLYCLDPAELTAEWVGRYVPRPATADVIDGALGLYRRQVGYNANFLYPRRGGIRVLADALAAAVPALRLAAGVREVHLAAREVVLASGERVAWDALVATVPLTTLAAITVDPRPGMREAAARLRAVAVENLNFGVRGAAPRREHWLYVPEERFPFYRVGLPSNHGELAPPGCHTVSVEVSRPSGTPASADLVEDCLAGLRELGLLRDPADVVVMERACLDPAYVIFDRARRAAVGELRDGFRAAGVWTAGRWAEWKYSTMEDALWDGADVAGRIAS